MVIFAVDNAGWKLMLYLLDNVYVNVAVGGGKVLLDLLVDEGGKDGVIRGG